MVDMDVIVIALFIFFNLDVDQLWIEYGTGKNKKGIPIHFYASLHARKNVEPFFSGIRTQDVTLNFLGLVKRQH